MGLKGHTTRDIFPDFKTYVYPPVSPAWFRPKAWAIGDTWDALTLGLVDFNASFISDGIEIGDAFYCLSTHRLASTVASIFTEALLFTATGPPTTVNNPLYKVGHGIHHTIQTLAAIYGKRAISHYTLHHGKLWTSAQIKDWATDETGEVYVISHDTGKALWLDGILDYLVGFPNDMEKPPELLNINNWEGRFPGEPRPHYPPGLEPGGDLRAALVNDHGTLLLAHDAKSKVEK